jgi:uncharacterized CHY-type Zn-finger protein
MTTILLTLLFAWAAMVLVAGALVHRKHFFCFVCHDMRPRHRQYFHATTGNRPICGLCSVHLNRAQQQQKVINESRIEFSRN